MAVWRRYEFGAKRFIIVKRMRSAHARSNAEAESRPARVRVCARAGARLKTGNKFGEKELTRMF